MRQFSVIRRRPNYVDLTILRGATDTSFRVAAASTFSGSFSTLFDVPCSSGYVDPNVGYSKIFGVALPDNAVRAVFDPASFSLTDTKQFWLRVTPYVNGVASADIDPLGLVLSMSERNSNNRYNIDGTAPNAASSDLALGLGLPRAADDVVFYNPSVNPLYVSFSRGGPEIVIPGNVDFTSSALGDQVMNLYVRGSGVTVPFRASFSQSFAL